MGLKQPMEVVPLWIDAATIRSTPPEEPSRGTEGGPALLFIGQLTPRKGYDLVVRALPRVLEAFPAVRLQVVSGLNPVDRGTMERMAADLGVGAHVEFLGRVEDATLVNLFRAAVLYVTPTRYEGFGLTLLEAMAAGCPVIASDIPVVDEIIHHGENGWLVPYDDPTALALGIIRLLGDAGLRRRLIDGGELTLQEQFDEQTLAGQVERVYTEAHATRSTTRVVHARAR